MFNPFNPQESPFNPQESVEEEEQPINYSASFESGEEEEQPIPYSTSFGSIENALLSEFPVSPSPAPSESRKPVERKKPPRPILPLKKPKKPTGKPKAAKPATAKACKKTPPPLLVPTLAYTRFPLSPSARAELKTSLEWIAQPIIIFWMDQKEIYAAVVPPTPEEPLVLRSNFLQLRQDARDVAVRRFQRKPQNPSRAPAKEELGGALENTFIWSGCPLSQYPHAATLPLDNNHPNAYWAKLPAEVRSVTDLYVAIVQEREEEDSKGSVFEVDPALPWTVESFLPYIFANTITNVQAVNDRVSVDDILERYGGSIDLLEVLPAIQATRRLEQEAPNLSAVEWRDEMERLQPPTVGLIAPEEFEELLLGEDY